MIPYEERLRNYELEKQELYRQFEKTDMTYAELHAELQKLIRKWKI